MDILKRDPERHPFRKGDIVTVFNTTFSGRKIIEGGAKIVGYCDLWDCYRVRFIGERFTYMRFVYVEPQADPNRHLSEMISRRERRRPQPASAGFVPPPRSEEDS